MVRQTWAGFRHHLTATPWPWLALLIIQATGVMWLSSPWLTSDSPVYLRLAHAIGGGYYGSQTPSGFEPDALRPPGYPLILWALGFLPRPLLIFTQLALCIGALVMVDRYLARRGIERFPFRLICLAYPFALFYGAVIMTEAWATIGLTLVALQLSRRVLTPTTLTVAGLASGATALVRGDMVLLPLLAALIALLRVRSWWLAAIPLLASATLLLPYAAWNLHHFGKFTPKPVAAAVGNSLYLASWQHKLPFEDLMSMYREPSPRAIASGLVADTARINARFGARPDNAPFNPADYPNLQQQIDSSEYFGRAAIDRIRRDPADYLGHLTTNAWALWNTSRYPAPAPVAVIFRVIAACVWLLGLAGALSAVGRRVPLGAASAVMIYPMLVHLPLHTEARYTAAARPLLVMFAALALLELARWAKRRWTPVEPINSALPSVP